MINAALSRRDARLTRLTPHASVEVRGGWLIRKTGAELGWSVVASRLAVACASLGLAACDASSSDPARSESCGSPASGAAPCPNEQSEPNPEPGTVADAATNAGPVSAPDATSDEPAAAAALEPDANAVVNPDPSEDSGAATQPPAPPPRLEPDVDAGEPEPETPAEPETLEPDDGSCEEGGVTYAEGEVIPRGDACTYCYCLGGSAVCSQDPCLAVSCEYEGEEYYPGEAVPSPVPACLECRCYVGGLDWSIECRSLDCEIQPECAGTDGSPLPDGTAVTVDGVECRCESARVECPVPVEPCDPDALLVELVPETATIDGALLTVGVSYTGCSEEPLRLCHDPIAPGEPPAAELHLSRDSGGECTSEVNRDVVFDLQRLLEDAAASEILLQLGPHAFTVREKSAEKLLPTLE